MPIIDFLERNAQLYGDEICLVEVNPELEGQAGLKWTEFNLVEAEPDHEYRREMTWMDFDRRSNRFANLLLTAGVKKGDKVAILLMNSLEWLPYTSVS
jgi:acyl-CoA synthetase (AMP-forming)/AMP-acid ligase II